MSPRKKPDRVRDADHPAVGGAPLRGDTAPLGDDGKPLSFEQALERLESIVEELEDGKLTLEQSIARFEEGVVLSRFLEGELGRAEKRVQELVETTTAGSPATRPWAGDDDAAEGDDDVDDDD